jgi:predicted transcriptional regulator
VFHLSSDFRHTYTREFFPNTTCIKKTEIGKIIGFSRSAVSKFLKRFDQRENIENKPRTGLPRSTSKQGQRTLKRLVKQDRRRSLRDLMNEAQGVDLSPFIRYDISRIKMKANDTLTSSETDA